MRRRPELESALSEASGEVFALGDAHDVGGGSISRAFRLDGSSRSVFAKIDGPDRLSLFRAEARGLDELRRAPGVRVPGTVLVGEYDGAAVLVLEYIALRPLGVGSAERLGEALAVMHDIRAERFGFDADNFIGATPQPNAPSDRWVEFFRDRRLGFQLSLAERAGAAHRVIERGRRLMDVLGVFFDDYVPSPSLLHGDLWAGNAAADSNGMPVLYDPAVYYGDREADIAMTELFGGFGRAFRGAYESVWPLDGGYRVRRTLYNLYHVLNHYNLFGGGYLGQAANAIDELLAEAGG